MTVCRTDTVIININRRFVLAFFLSLRLTPVQLVVSRYLSIILYSIVYPTTEVTENIYNAYYTFSLQCFYQPSIEGLFYYIRVVIITGRNIFHREVFWSASNGVVPKLNLHSVGHRFRRKTAGTSEPGHVAITSAKPTRCFYPNGFQTDCNGCLNLEDALVCVYLKSVCFLYDFTLTCARKCLQAVSTHEL